MRHRYPPPDAYRHYRRIERAFNAWRGPQMDKTVRPRRGLGSESGGGTDERPELFSGHALRDGSLSEAGRRTARAFSVAPEDQLAGMPPRCSRDLSSIRPGPAAQQARRLAGDGLTLLGRGLGSRASPCRWLRLRLGRSAGRRPAQQAGSIAKR